MTVFHAPDPMGKAAHHAALLVSRFDLRLLAASSPTLTREQRAENLTKALAQWPKITRAMAELESVAPNASNAGFEEDAQMQDFVEGRGGR